MLRQIRAGMKRALVILFALPLIVAFAAWGVPEISQLTKSYAVKVGKSGVSANEVQREFDRYAANQRLASNGEFDRDAAIAAGVPGQVVEALAARMALEQEISRLGLVMPRDAVRDFLQSSDQFKNPRTGKFDNEVLNELLRQYNFSVAEFESRLQSDLLRSQLLSSVGAGGAAPKGVVDALILRETEQRVVSYLTVANDVAGAASVATPELLKDYYDKNISQFMAPEFRTFNAVILKNADFVEEDAFPDSELQKIYETNRAKYESPERRTIRQITFEDKAAADEAAKALKSGVPFETIAANEGKSLAGTTLENALKGDILDPKVASGTFGANEAGAVVGPIEGVFGFTVAQVAAITPASVKPFEEVRDEIRAETQSRDTRKKLFDTIEVMENERDTGASLQSAAQKAGAIAIEYGPIDSYSFGAGGEIVAGVPGEVLKTAFTLEEGEESDAIELSDKSGYYFVAVNEIKAPAAIPYDKVAEEVEAKWTKAELDGRIDATVKAVREAMAKGQSLKDAAAKFDRAPLQNTITRRAGNPAFSEPLLEQVFSASIGEPISGPAPAGDAQVIAVVDSVSYDTALIGPENAAMFGQYVGNQLSQELVDAYANSLVSDAKVHINQDQIDTQFAAGQ